MIEKKYIAIVGLAATVLVTSACMRNAPVNSSETESETSTAEPSAVPMEQTAFTFGDLTAHQAFFNNA